MKARTYITIIIVLTFMAINLLHDVYAFARWLTLGPDVLPKYNYLVRCHL